jgi:hypothetical protein
MVMLGITVAFAGLVSTKGIGLSHAVWLVIPFTGRELFSSAHFSLGYIAIATTVNGS